MVVIISEQEEYDDYLTDDDYDDESYSDTDENKKGKNSELDDLVNQAIGAAVAGVSLKLAKWKAKKIQEQEEIKATADENSSKGEIAAKKEVSVVSDVAEKNAKEAEPSSVVERKKVEEDYKSTQTEQQPASAE